MRLVRGTALAALLWGQVWSLAAQDAAAAARPLRVMTLIELSFSGGPAEQETWAWSLDTALAKSPRVREVKRGPGAHEALALAGLEGFQFIVRVTATLDSGADTAEAVFTVVDVLSEKTVAEGRFAGPLPDERELAETFWLPLTAAVEAAQPTERSSYVRLRAAPGTRVSGFSKEPVLIGDEGEARIQAVVPATFAWRAVKSGAQDQSGVFAALDNDALLAIPLVPLRRWMVESALVMSQFPDLWFGVNARQNRLFFKFGLEQYLFGFFLPSRYGVEPYDGMIVSLPMIMPGLAMGVRFGSSAAFIRPYLAATALMHVNTELGVIDPIGPVSGTLAAGFDWRIVPRFTLFAEIGATLYPGANGPLMVASRGTDDGGPVAYAYDDEFYAEWPTLRFGARFFL